MSHPAQMHRTLLTALMLALPVLPSAAQLSPDWQPMDDLNAALPPTIRVYQDAALRAFYVRADTSGDEWSFQALLSDDASGVEQVESFAEDTEAFVAVNGGFFGGGASVSLVAHEGRVLVPNIEAIGRTAGTYYPTRAAFGRLVDGALDAAWIYNVNGTQFAYPAPSPNTRTAPQPRPSAVFPDGANPWPVYEGIGGGPMLVQDGEVVVTWEEEVFFEAGDIGVNIRRERTSVGYTAGGDLLFVVMPATLNELAGVLVDLGAVEAINLDGGGSTSLVVNGRELHVSGRPVASAVVLAPPPDGGGTGGGAEYVVDTGDACCYREEGADWFESANTPFYGGTPARLNAAGTGADRAVFVVPDLPPGRYEVSAWWVAAGNRATNTPYTVYHDGTGTTVRVDQSDLTTLNTWNALGTFDLAPGDSVVVTDDAVGATSPAYVTVDAVRFVQRTGTARAPVPETLRDLALQVYPNPAADFVHLRLEGPGRAADGAVYDVLGRVVRRFRIEPGAATHRLVVSDLAAGLYLVEVRSGGRMARRPVLLMRSW